MGRGGRIVVVLAMLAGVTALVVFAAFAYVGSEPETATFVTAHRSGQPLQLVAQTDGAVGTGAHPTWVSFQVQDPSTGKWLHTTLWRLPAHTHVDVTIYQFDSGSPLRNQTWGRVTGTSGGTATLDKRPFRVLNSYEQTVGHTFSVPSLGINVPLKGVKTTEKGFCTLGPCDPSKQLHHTVTFSFTTPGPGDYRFQCFIPCGAGYYGGNGGPMQTLGYMGGFLEVV